jgi:spore germination protein KB
MGKERGKQPIMLKEGRFGVQETVCLLAITITAKVFFSSPTYVVKIVGTSGWLMTLISAMITGVAFFFTYTLIKLFPNKNIMDIHSIVWGKTVGSILSLTLSVGLMLTAVINLREFTEVLNVYVLPSSPPIFIIYLFIAVLIVLCYLELETIARFSKLLAYVLLAGFIFIIILGIKNYDINNVFPFWGHGFHQTFINGIKRSSAYGELMIIFVIAKSLQGKEHIKKAGILSLVLSGFFIAVSLLAFSLTFPYYVGQEITAPIYLLSSIIEYGVFFQRVESLFLMIWIVCSLISITASFYISLYINAYVLKLDDKKPLIIPYAVILAVATLLPTSIIQTLDMVQNIREYGWILFFVPPLVTLLVAKIRRMPRSNYHA